MTPKSLFLSKRKDRDVMTQMGSTVNGVDLEREA